MGALVRNSRPQRIRSKKAPPKPSSVLSFDGIARLPRSFAGLCPPFASAARRRGRRRFVCGLERVSPAPAHTKNNCAVRAHNPPPHPQPLNSLPQRTTKEQAQGRLRNEKPFIPSCPGSDCMSSCRPRALERARTKLSLAPISTPSYSTPIWRQVTLAPSSKSKKTAMLAFALALPRGGVQQAAPPQPALRSILGKQLIL